MISYGSKTVYINENDIGKFESSVISYGSKTRNLDFTLFT